MVINLLQQQKNTHTLLNTTTTNEIHTNTYCGIFNIYNKYNSKHLPYNNKNYYKNSKSTYKNKLFLYVGNQK